MPTIGSRNGVWAAASPWWWPTVKIVLTGVLVIAVAWQFADILSKPDLWTRPFSISPGWITAAAVLYLAGLGTQALFWYGLLRTLSQRPLFLASLRAFYVGQLGRYVPGKVIGMAMRARLLTGPGVQPAVAVLTVVYESLTTLASGVLLGLLVLGLEMPGSTGPDWRALALLAVLGGLLTPRVYNWLVERTARRFKSSGAAPLPRVRGATLLVGLPITAGGWLLQGASLWALVTALAPDARWEPAGACVRCAAYAGLAYAGGYIVLAAPGGLGVRDFLIQQFLTADLSRTLGPEQAAAVAVVSAVILRLLWTVMDLAAAGACYWLPGQMGTMKERAN